MQQRRRPAITGTLGEIHGRSPAVLVALTLLALTACTSMPPRSPVTGPSTAHFGDPVVAFDYPGTWQRASFEVVSSFSTALVYLATEPLSDPCTRSPGTTACDHMPVAGLGPDGLLVTWSRQSFPGWTFDPTVGRSMTVDGRRATIEELATPTPACSGIDGEREVVVTIDDPVPDANWTEMRACIRGPDVDGRMRELGALLESTTFAR